jgi:hypothetical protein
MRNLDLRRVSINAVEAKEKRAKKKKAAPKKKKETS